MTIPTKDFNSIVVFISALDRKKILQVVEVVEVKKKIFRNGWSHCADTNGSVVSKKQKQN
jgi:hypothetical protein